MNNKYTLFNREGKLGNIFKYIQIFSVLALVKLSLHHRQTSKPRPIENEKMCKIFRVRYGRILGGSWSTNTPYWLKHYRIVLPTNTKVVAHSGRQVAD